MIVVPPAKGKTRIAAGIALSLAKRRQTKKLVLVHQSELLQQQDAGQWEQIKAFIVGLNVQFVSVVGYQACMDATDNDSVVIIDEADVNFIDEAEKPPKQYRSLICLTATIPEIERGFVKERLQELKFHIDDDYGYKPFAPPEPEAVESIQDFFENKSKRCGVLVYTDAAQLDKVREEAKQHFDTVEVNCKDLNLIRAMEDCCLIVTDETLMRGVDYRLKM